MTARERAAQVLLEAELELQAAVRAAYFQQEGGRQRLARAKHRMALAVRRGYRALGVQVPSSESRLLDFGLWRAGADAAAEALTRALTQIDSKLSRRPTAGRG